jgi:23S rRNA (guanosine2251-2'-O)-methyltransferase
MIIEGRNAVREALSSNTTIDKLLVAKGLHDGSIGMLLHEAKERNIRVTFVDKAVLDKESVTKHHQGILAYVTDFTYADLDEILTNKRGDHHFILILDEIEDPHNFGSIVRVAECMGVDGIVIGARRQVPVNETVIKTSAGATSHMRIAKVGNINDAIRTLREQFITVYALDMDGTPIAESHLTGDLALVVGNEGSGVKVLTRKLSDGAVSIPMFGKVASLNASVAAGIALYEANRQRK